MAKQPGRRVNKAGRSGGEARFVQLPYWLLETPAARSLSGTAFKVLVYVVKRFNGVNNGAIAFGSRSGCYIRKAGIREFDDVSIGLAPRTISDALYELENAGFIVCTKSSSFGQKRMTREWRLTWLPGHDAKVPTKEFTTTAGEFKRAKKQNAGRVAALSPQLQGAQPLSNDPSEAQIVDYRARARSMEQSHRAPARPHIVTIPWGNEGAVSSAARVPQAQRASAHAPPPDDDHDQPFSHPGPGGAGRGVH